MPRKNKIGKSSSKINTATTSRERSSLEKLSQEKRYEGYDEDRADLNPVRQSDYNMDENHIEQRSDEHKGR